nr:hypothetical protein HK105_001465 [Polyrhizophydium stewartii]
MLAVHAAANAARISLGHADPLRIDAWISLDGASATTAIVAILLEFGRWNFVESARADALEAFLFNRTDGNGNKIPVPSFEENASLVGKLLFTWINPLIRKSSRTPLEHEDVWDLCEVDRVKNLTRRFNESK